MRQRLEAVKQAGAHALMDALVVDSPSGPLASPHAARRHGRGRGGRRTTACRGWTRPTGKRTNRDGDVCTDAIDARRQAARGDGRTGAHHRAGSTHCAFVRRPRQIESPFLLLFFSSSPSSSPLRCSRRIIADYYSATTTRHSSSDTDTDTARPLHSCMPCPPPLSLSLSLRLSLAALSACLLPLSISSPARVSAAHRASCQLSVTGRGRVCRPRSCQAGLAAGG